VRLVARGRPAEPHASISLLQIGPAHAIVDGVVVEWRDECEERHDFRVVR
jgi:hypothetical protein